MHFQIILKSYQVKIAKLLKCYIHAFIQLKVSQFQNGFMKSSFLPKYEPNIVRQVVRISTLYCTIVHYFVVKAFSISNDKLNFIGFFCDLTQIFDLNSYNRNRNSTTGIILSFTWPCFAERVEILSTIYHQKLTTMTQSQYVGTNLLYNLKSF